MKHRWAALFGVLALSAFMPRVLAAQVVPTRTDSSQTSRDRPKGFELGQNYPNPFNPETHIPFSVGDPPECRDTKKHRVSLRILNLLAQEVAVPVLKGGAGDVAGGEPLSSVVLPCGAYTAYWDGKYKNTNKEAASGVYYYRLEVDGKIAVKKMIIMK